MKSLRLLGGLALVVAAAPVMAQGNDAATGKKLFQQKCAVCHQLPEQTPPANRVGPALQGVVGRKAGTLESFAARYSPALKAHAVVWNDKTLGAYLDAPLTAVKGGRMAFAGLKKPDERAAVIAYLKANKAK